MRGNISPLLSWEEGHFVISGMKQVESGNYKYWVPRVENKDNRSKGLILPETQAHSTPSS